MICMSDICNSYVLISLSLLFCFWTLHFEIHVKSFFVCILDLEWKLIYVGSAEDENYDQQLESVLVGPVNVGTYRFVLQVFKSMLCCSILLTPKSKHSRDPISPEFFKNKVLSTACDSPFCVKPCYSYLILKTILQSNCRLTHQIPQRSVKKT